MNSSTTPWRAALVAGALVLMTAGCAGGSADSRSADGTVGGSVAEAPEPASGPDGASGTDAASRAAGESADGRAEPASTYSRSVISTATMSLTSADVTKTRQDVQRVIDRVRGTIAEENSEAYDGKPSYLRMVVRVPAAEFDRSLVELSQVAEVTASDRSSEDVTTEVIDTDVRVRAKKASLRRVEQLLARATSLKDIAWIEQQLTDRQSELDSLQQQQRWLADQTSLSTITLDLNRRHRPAKETEEENGFLDGLATGWDGLVEFTRGTAHTVGVLLPFAVPLLALAYLGRVLVRRRRRRPSLS